MLTRYRASGDPVRDGEVAALDISRERNDMKEEKCCQAASVRLHRTYFATEALINDHRKYKGHTTCFSQ